MYFSKKCMIQELVSNFCRTTCVSLSFTSYNNCKFCNIIFYNILFQNTLDISFKKKYLKMFHFKSKVLHIFFHKMQVLYFAKMQFSQLRNNQQMPIYKGKAVPLQAWSGPEGSRNLSFPDFMTTAQIVGKVVSLTHRPSLSPGNTPGTLIILIHVLCIFYCLVLRPTNAQITM